MTTTYPPYETTDYSSLFYVKSAEKSVLWNIFPQALSFEPLKLDYWSDYANGINGLLDFRVELIDEQGIRNNHTRTLSFHADGITPVEFELAHEFPATNSTIFMITPVFNRTKAFKRSIKSLIELSKVTPKGSVEYCFIDFEGDDLIIHDELERYKSDLSNITTKILNFQLPFRKAAALQSCIDQAREDDIIFIMDVDISYDHTVLDPVRRFVVKHQRFYAPIVYYDKNDEDPLIGDKFTGWANTGTGMIALYKSDVMRFGGYDTDLFTDRHGFEDTDFFFSARSLKMQVARPQDANLIHRAHTIDGWRDSARKDLLECPNLKETVFASI